MSDLWQLQREQEHHHATSQTEKPKTQTVTAQADRTSKAYRTDARRACSDSSGALQEKTVRQNEHAQHKKTTWRAILLDLSKTDKIQKTIGNKATRVMEQANNQVKNEQKNNSEKHHSEG